VARLYDTDARVGDKFSHRKIRENKVLEKVDAIRERDRGGPQGTAIDRGK